MAMSPEQIARLVKQWADNGTNTEASIGHFARVYMLDKDSVNRVRELVKELDAATQD